MERAWNIPFAGESHRVLKAVIQDMFRRRADRSSDFASGNFVPIIQSSGMGKSWTVHEVAGRIFMLPFNLRRAGDRGTSNFDHIFVLELNLSLRLSAGRYCCARVLRRPYGLG